MTEVHKEKQLTFMIFSITGSAKARVLPDPVLARPIRSRPLLAGSYTCFWMGNRLVIPRALRASSVTSERPQLSSCITTINTAVQEESQMSWDTQSGFQIMASALICLLFMV